MCLPVRYILEASPNRVSSHPDPKTPRSSWSAGSLISSSLLLTSLLGFGSPSPYSDLSKETKNIPNFSISSFMGKETSRIKSLVPSNACTVDTVPGLVFLYSVFSVCKIARDSEMVTRELTECPAEEHDWQNKY
ncbi:hypothetical protein BDA96_05G041000 [Sorghum bicolor]|uniref:Uncharacterized protein n=2 Tax=Sorghum bicolor TaxID=4558 RepID=A0A921QW34_SORBI|nr:hypothetical protein BDA96_05G041000 [Sorghum bicolor]OQU82889.1 hypothetical protein SORBI_3005G038450 [Sorghum bicolor]